MSIDFSTLQGLTIPEGVVTQITDASGRVMWMVANDEPIVLEVEKITSNTYAGETEYADEQFILLDIYPKRSNSVVSVTYGGLTKTLNFSGTNVQQVYFGTFNGVSDEVATPACGELVIDGSYEAFAVGTYKAKSSLSKVLTQYCGCVTAIKEWGHSKNVNDYAFTNCTSLSQVALPSGIESIGAYAFEDCSGLASINISNGVTNIGSNAFHNCTSLSFVEIPESITKISNSAFLSCSSLENITIYSNNDIIIGDSAFRNGKNYEVVINGQPKWIGSGAFRAVEQSETYHNIRFINHDWNWDKWAQCNPPYRETYRWESINGERKTMYYRQYINGVETINITGDIILKDCETISDYAFYDFREISSVTMPNTLTSIGSYAFSECKNISSFTIPDSVTSVGDYAFSRCESLASVTIGNGVTSIESHAFYGSESLTRAQYSGDIDEWLNIKFVDAYSNPMYYTKNLYLRDKPIAESVTLENITNIGDYSLINCTGLVNVTIGNSVTNIGTSAFEGCAELTNVYYQGDIAGWLNIKFNNKYSNPMYYGEHLFFNGELVADGIVIPDSVTSVGDYAFYNCTSLASVTIGNSVTNIGTVAFYNCTSLASVTIPDSVTSIGSGAFEECTSLASVTIPDSVTSIGSGAFKECTSLTSITIGNGVTSIGTNAFFDCTGLTSIVIPSSVTSIENFAFNRCTGLMSVTFENTSGWYVTMTEGGDASTGESVDVSNPINNVTLLTDTHDYKYWYRS